MNDNSNQQQTRTFKYAGIGSRETPPDVLTTMKVLGRKLAERGYTLRTGGAPGADTAFHDGCMQVGGPVELYIPWDGFEKKHYARNGAFVLPDPIPTWILEIAQHYHPAWYRLKQGGRKLMCRNTYQILGPEPETNPVFSDFVVCWTQDGDIVGGTGQAMRLAQDLEIPVVNLYNENAIAQLRELIS